MDLDKDSSWLVKTKQMWKVKVFSILAVISLLFFYLMIWNTDNPQYDLFVDFWVLRIGFRDGFSIVGLITMVAVFFWIRCPNCKKRPVYYIVSNTDMNVWVSVLLSIKECPLCKDDGTLKNDHGKLRPDKN